MCITTRGASGGADKWQIQDAEIRRWQEVEALDVGSKVIWASEISDAHPPP